jgi:hypothetical protein
MECHGRSRQAGKISLRSQTSIEANQRSQLWTNAYTDNLKLYNARVHSYKSGNVSAKDMTDEEAAHYAETHNIGVGPLEPTADGQLTSEALMDLPAAVAAAVEDEEEEPPTPKTPPKSKSGRKVAKPKSGGTATSTPATIVPPAASSAIVPPGAKPAATEVEKEKSPDKKRKRTSKAAKGKEADEPVESIEKEAEAPKTAEKGKPRKKKSKSDA